MMTHKLCSCGQLIDLQSAHWIGIQGGQSQTLDLYNCPTCNSTVSAPRDVDPELDSISIEPCGEFTCTIDDYDFYGHFIVRYGIDECRLVEFTLMDGKTLIQEPKRRSLVKQALQDYLDDNCDMLLRLHDESRRERSPDKADL